MIDFEKVTRMVDITPKKEPKTIDEITISEITKMIPSRPPILMLDRVVSVVVGQSATGLKNVTINEPYFSGQFKSPVMPAGMILECMSQTAMVFLSVTVGERDLKNKSIYTVSAKNIHFRRPISPGSSLQTQLSVLRNRNNLWKLGCKILADDRLAAEATFNMMVL